MMKHSRVQLILNIDKMQYIENEDDLEKKNGEEIEILFNAINEQHKNEHRQFILFIDNIDELVRNPQSLDK